MRRELCGSAARPNHMKLSYLQEEFGEAASAATIAMLWMCEGSNSSLNYSQNCHVGVQSATVRASQPPSERVRLDSHTVGLIQHQPAASSGSCCPGWCQVRRRELTRARRAPGETLQLSAGGGAEPGCAGKTCTLQNSHKFGYFEHTGANVSAFFKYHNTWLLKCIH